MRDTCRAFVKAYQAAGRLPQGEEGYTFKQSWEQLARFQAFVNNQVDYTKHVDLIWADPEESDGAAERPGEPVCNAFGVVVTADPDTPAASRASRQAGTVRTLRPTCFVLLFFGKTVPPQPFSAVRIIWYIRAGLLERCYTLHTLRRIHQSVQTCLCWQDVGAMCRDYHTCGGLEAVPLCDLREAMHKLS
eukprot:1177769-Amphidinium_carterae.1